MTPGKIDSLNSTRNQYDRDKNFGNTTLEHWQEMTSAELVELMQYFNDKANSWAGINPSAMTAYRSNSFEVKKIIEQRKATIK